MKTIYFLLIGVCFSLSNINIYGQSPIQKRYSNETYNAYKWIAFSGADTSTTIVNRKNTLNMDKLKERCMCDPRTMDIGLILSKIMKSVFPQEKRKAFATDKKRIRYILFYDAKNGQILNIEFELYGVKLSYEENSLTAVTLKEIYQLETQLKAQHLKIDCDCTKFKYGYVIYSMPLDKMDKWSE